MNHDELLTKIQNNGTLETQLECTCPHIEVKEIPTREHRNDKALRAVVELHKPIETYNTNNVHKSWLTCTHCNDEMYPCPTIQAIEKELR
jgi:hypothetical protein